MAIYTKEIWIKSLNTIVRPTRKDMLNATALNKLLANLSDSVVWGDGEDKNYVAIIAADEFDVNNQITITHTLEKVPAVQIFDSDYKKINAVITINGVVSITISTNSPFIGFVVLN